MDNKRLCYSCGKLIHEHNEEQLQTCARKNDKRRHLVGRRAFSQCCLINPTNPDAVARNIEKMYRLLKEVRQRSILEHHTYRKWHDEADIILTVVKQKKEA